MGRFLVAFVGPQSGQWLFLGVVAHFADALEIAKHWRDSQIFDLSIEPTEMFTNGACFRCHRITLWRFDHANLIWYCTDCHTSEGYVTFV